MSFTPLETSEVLASRADSKERERAHLTRQIAARESQIGHIAQEIRWLKLELEALL